MARPKTLPHIYTENDTAPPLLGEYKDSSAVAIDVTGYTITLHIKRPSAPLVKAATLTDPTNGLFQFDFTAGDLEAGQDQAAEVQFVTPGGAIFTGPEFCIDVRAEIA